MGMSLLRLRNALVRSKDADTPRNWETRSHFTSSFARQERLSKLALWNSSVICSHLALRLLPLSYIWSFPSSYGIPSLRFYHTRSISSTCALPLLLFLYAWSIPSSYTLPLLPFSHSKLIRSSYGNMFWPLYLIDKAFFILMDCLNQLPTGIIRSVACLPCSYDMKFQWVAGQRPHWGQSQVKCEEILSVRPSIHS